MDEWRTNENRPNERKGTSVVEKVCLSLPTHRSRRRNHCRRVRTPVANNHRPSFLIMICIHNVLIYEFTNNTKRLVKKNLIAERKSL